MMQVLPNGQARFEFIVGIGLRSQFREYLEIKRFNGFKIEWLETGGWSKSFHVHGDANHIRQIHDELDVMVNQQNASQSS